MARKYLLMFVVRGAITKAKQHKSCTITLQELLYYVRKKIRNI